MARPTKYKAEYAGQVYKLCLLGATDEQIADFFEVSVQTVFNWTEAHPAFLEARKNGKVAADANVAEALYHRALGYEHDEEKIFQYEGAPIRVATRKKYPPDTAAAFIWLKNRAGWRDKQDVDLRTPDGVQVEVAGARQKLEKRLDGMGGRLAEFVADNGNGKHGNGNGAGE